MRTIKKSPYKSYVLGELAKGCSQCVDGKKLVVFITGVCNNKCFYCPLSDQKAYKDVVYANEHRIDFKKLFGKRQIDVLKKEAELSDARGAGITGGDPLLVIDRTVKVIRELKRHFGEKFHIHLYTTPRNVTKERLDKLHASGLDEIRLHPLIWDDKDWHKIQIALDYSWDVGVEIPAIPGMLSDTKKLIDFLSDKIMFLNLNELEISDTNAQHLLERGYVPKDRISYGVKESEKVALKLMSYVLKKKYGFNVHYCTTTLKDSVQMANRIKRRAKNTALNTDRITSEGMLIRGVAYFEELKPGFDYRKKLEKLSPGKRRSFLAKLKKLKHLINESQIDSENVRLLCSEDEIKFKAGVLKKAGLVPVIIEEYPTYDAMPVEVEFL